MSCFRANWILFCLTSPSSPNWLLFNLISSYPLEPACQPFSCLPVFVQAVLAAWIRSSLCFTSSNYTCDMYGGQGRGCPSIRNARARQALQKRWQLNWTSPPPDNSSAYRPPVLAFNHMCAVFIIIWMSCLSWSEMPGSQGPNTTLACVIYRYSNKICEVSVLWRNVG